MIPDFGIVSDDESEYEGKTPVATKQEQDREARTQRHNA